MMKYKYEDAIVIANQILEEIEPHCYRSKIAGSLRRRRPEVKDIDIVCIPKPYNFGLLESGIAEVVNQWTKVKGEMDTKCKETQRILPQGIKLDLFMCVPENYGYKFAMKTGSQRFNMFRILPGLERMGYKSIDGFLYRDNKLVPVYEEEDLFKCCGLKYIEPWNR